MIAMGSSDGSFDSAVVAVGSVSSETERGEAAWGTAEGISGSSFDGGVSPCDELFLQFSHLHCEPQWTSFW